MRLQSAIVLNIIKIKNFYLNILIPINLANLKCYELSDIIILFKPNSSVCERCSHENYNEIILKKNNFYLTLKKI